MSSSQLEAYDSANAKYVGIKATPSGSLLNNSGHVAPADTVTALPNTLTTIATIDVSNVDQIFVTTTVTTYALAAYQITAKPNSGASYVTLYSAAGDYTSPAGALIDASGDLTSQAVGAGWFILDVKGMSSVQLKATSSNVAGSGVTVSVGGN